jgi:TPP-dependent pyruvate/acetoin dehydrogenase alpha subunit
MTTELNKQSLQNAYLSMRRIREFEERVHVEFATGEIPGFVHLYAGEEASATGVIMHLRNQDYLASTHRGHGHCIAKGLNVRTMMAEIYGKKPGICGGKGGSMHVADLHLGMMGANGIVGGGGPLVCGAALAAKIKHTDNVAVCFFGDGASNQGTILESLNLASVWRLPAIFVAENNGYAESTAARWAVATGNIADRAAAFDMPGAIVDGHDFFAVYEAAGEAIGRARAGGGPSLIEVKVNRYFGHFEGDQQTYRGLDEVKKIRATKDCLMLYRQRVTKQGLLTGQELDQIDDQVRREIEDAVAFAKAAPKPQASDLLTDVYVAYA